MFEVCRLEDGALESWEVDSFGPVASPSEGFASTKPSKFTGSSRSVVLVLGGCHVEGYSIGAEHGFSSLLAADDGPCAEHDIIVVPQFFKRRIAEVLQTVADGRRIAAVVLQIGHRETVSASRSPRPDWAKGKVSGASGASLSLSPDATRSTVPLGNYARAILLNVALTMLGRKWLGFEPLRASNARFEERFAAEVEQLFMALRQADVTRVIVLSAFPSAKRLLNAKRQVVNRVLSATSRRFGWSYVDVWRLLAFRRGPLKDLGRPALLVDDAHLSRAGHRIVAQACANSWN